MKYSRLYVPSTLMLLMALQLLKWVGRNFFLTHWSQCLFQLICSSMRTVDAEFCTGRQNWVVYCAGNFLLVDQPAVSLWYVTSSFEPYCIMANVIQQSAYPNAWIFKYLYFNTLSTFYMLLYDNSLILEIFCTYFSNINYSVEIQSVISGHMYF